VLKRSKNQTKAVIAFCRSLRHSPILDCESKADRDESVKENRGRERSNELKQMRQDRELGWHDHRRC
jgi:hypothetical protein